MGWNAELYLIQDSDLVVRCRERTFQNTEVPPVFNSAFEKRSIKKKKNFLISYLKPGGKRIKNEYN